jgi:Zn-dependent M28 family amino/carboxypeptidase
MEIKPDARPEAGHYYRSDHFSMARVGVPSFSVGQGMKFVGHPAEWGRQQAEDYTTNRYHQPSDEYRPEMIFSGDAKMAEFGIALGWKAANAPSLPGWQAGDEFEAARKASENISAGK